MYSHRLLELVLMSAEGYIMLTWATWGIVVGALWIFTSVGFAWLFGAACRLGGSSDERLPKCQHGIPHGTVCGQCKLYTMEPKLLTLPPKELEVGAKHYHPVP
jgi:hypothetical protein